MQDWQNHFKQVAVQLVRNGASKAFRIDKGLSSQPVQSHCIGDSQLAVRWTDYSRFTVREAVITTFVVLGRAGQWVCAGWLPTDQVIGRVARKL